MLLYIFIFNQAVPTNSVVFPEGKEIWKVYGITDLGKQVLKFKNTL